MTERRVLTPQDYADILSAIAYKPGYRLLLRQDQQIVSRVINEGPASYTGETNVGRWYIQVECDRPDSFTDLLGVGRGGKGYLSPHMIPGEIVRKAFGLFAAYEEHECREFFTYKGKRVFGPHISIDALLEVADQVEARDSEPGSAA